jgi:hypothetical protein
MNGYTQRLPEWNFSSKNKKIVLISFYNGQEELLLQRTDSLIYSLADVPFYSSPNIVATFPGGKDSLSIFIKKHLKYMIHTIYPKVYVAFIVSTTGKISNIGLYRGVDNSYNRAAIDVVLKMPDWQPAISEDRYVNSFNIIAIDFAIR